MTEKRRNTLKAVLTGIIALTITSFFVHSLMPSEVSSAESEGVASMLSAILSPDTPFGAFVINNVRKIAHFCEYGVLGLELALYIVLLIKNKKRGIICAFAFAHSVAFIDESLQIISGRGPMIADVWLDMLGFAVFFGASLALSYFIAKIKLQKEKQHG